MTSSSARSVDLSEHLFDVESEEQESSPQEALSPEMAAMVAKVTTRQANRRKRKTVAASVFARTLAEVDHMIKTGDWSEAKPRHMVALYERMHVKCYGFEPIELDGAARYNFTFVVANMVKGHFAGDILGFVAFMRWAWTEEIAREKWRRDNGREGGKRVGPGLMFSKGYLSDYLLALARKPHCR